MIQTNLSKYLTSERIRRGYISVSDYLREYDRIPISESYYRDLEAGRKVIRIDHAEPLCEALQLNKQHFYIGYVSRHITAVLRCQSLCAYKPPKALYLRGSTSMTTHNGVLSL